MKTIVWKRLTWDLQIIYNKLTKQYILQQWDRVGWINLEYTKKKKKIIKKKHQLIKKRISDWGLLRWM